MTDFNYVYQLSWLLILQEEDKIKKTARNGNIHTLQELTSSGVDVIGIVYDGVSMCVASYTIKFVILHSVI